ncbi:hypothetical protein VSX64_01785 [Aurantimonas sp. C2-6-R+9]|uniref:hypothetical protein n=1 Tax=unclassified Aurantimonas TaxID=2638230 RepID=UPI002E194D5F|nr:MULTISPECIES: hypothetical protein [unclassified Aurantimonas]MEC5289657.1 hypothetical protein [Aurantimonas sp. C2-3-R2]MEC5379620.1 hypothetical protein [Aurantimonas sp. C2-6-R+9]MEC5410737.1 hypothetical protein [Aurantimonas sp. C2-4-R8]
MGGQRDDGKGGTDREDPDLTTQRPTLRVTDMAVWRPHTVSKEFEVHAIHPGATRAAIEESCGWSVRYADDCGETQAPTPDGLATLRDLQRRTAEAHRRSAA